MAKDRKPLRRTAWWLLLGGLAGMVLMFGVGGIAVVNAPRTGPHQEASWPAGETMSVSRIPFPFGPVQESPESGADCTVTPAGRDRESHWFGYGEPNSTDFTGTATITCDQTLAVLTGAPRVVAHYTRGPLIMVPILATLLGILAFFPRFTYIWSRAGAGRFVRPWPRTPPRP